MFEILKKGIFTGIGIASLTKEKIQELSKDIARHAELSEQQAKEFESNLVDRATQAREDLIAAIDRRIDYTLTQIGLLKEGVQRRAEDAQNEVQRVIDDRVDRALNGALDRLKVVRQDELNQLKARLELLESRLP